MKKTVYGLIVGCLAMLGTVVMAQSATPTQGDSWDPNAGENWTQQGPGWIMGQTETQGSKLIDSIKSFINWMLGMLATIALVICLYAGFLMVTAAGDDTKYKKGLDILKKSGIGLIVIGLSWMIVSLVMWVIGNMTA